MKITKEQIKAYFEKAPSRQKFITEMRRCVAHEMIGDFVNKYDICRTLYGFAASSKIEYLLERKPENKDVIECWRKWIDKGVYPISEVKYFHEKPISKNQKITKKTGLARVNRVVIKLVSI